MPREEETRHAAAVADRTRELNRAGTEVANAAAAHRLASAEAVRACSAWDKMAKRLPRRKEKPGRPSIWRGYLGLHLVMTVAEIRGEGPRRSVAQALRLAVKNDALLKSKMQTLDDRELQARYQEAADYWAFLSGGARDARQRAAWGACEAAQAQESAAAARYGKAMVALDRLLARGRGNPYRIRDFP